MQKQQGFSLSEILITLFLVSTVVITVVKQQWYSASLLKHLILKQKALFLLEDAAESLLGGIKPGKKTVKPLALEIAAKEKFTNLVVTWKMEQEQSCHLELTVATG